MEKVAYESLPGFWVTANLYLPANSSGRVPAIVLAPGHGAGGKSENWSWGANFARNGIVVLAYDPIGQGERLQYLDGDKPASIVGGPTGEHGEANIGPLLLGDTLARYMVNDAIRGIDYLTTRPETRREPDRRVRLLRRRHGDRDSGRALTHASRPPRPPATSPRSTRS